MTPTRASGRTLLATAAALAAVLLVADRVPAFAAARRQMWGQAALSYQELLSKLPARLSFDVDARIRGARDSDVAPAPPVTPAEGLHAAPFWLRFAAGDEGKAERSLHVTRDGSIPDWNSPRVTDSVFIDSTTVVRWRVLRRGSLPGDVGTALFVVDTAMPPIPVLGVTIDPIDLSGKYVGLYANPERRGRAFERPVHLSLIMPDGDPLAFDAQIRIRGGYSRRSPKKSFRIRYDVQGIPSAHPMAWLLRRDRVTGERHLVVRTTGTAALSRVADGLSTALFDRLGAPVSRGQAVWMILNGADWGLYELCEYISVGFLQARVGPGSYELLSHDSEQPARWVSPVAGSVEHWERALRFLETRDLAQPAQFDSAARFIDPVSMADYWAHNIYAGNLDWPYNNSIVYRDSVRRTPFRFLLWDADASFGSLGDFVGHNTLAWALRDRPADSLKWNAARGGAPDAPRFVAATVPMRAFLRNRDFRDAFVTRFLVRLSTQYRADAVQPILDSIVAYVEPVIARDLARWGQPDSVYRAGVARMHEFVHRRPAIVRQHLAARFALGEDRSLTVDVRGPGAVHIAGIAMRDTTVALTMLDGLRIGVDVQPDPGARTVTGSGSRIVIEPGSAPHILRVRFAR